MNIIDEINEMVRTAPISIVDGSFVQGLDAVKAYEGIEKQEGYQTVVSAFVSIYKDCIAKGIPAERGAGFVLKAHEDLTRYVITKAIRARFANMTGGSLQHIGSVIEASQLQKKIESLKSDVQKEEEEKMKRAAKANVDQFKAYLHYAADRFGTPEEKKVVEGLVAKIS